MLGSLAAVLAGASYGIAFAYMRKHLTSIEPIVAATGQLLMATALSLPFAVGTSITSGIHLDPHIVLSIVLLGVVGTGFAYILNYRVIADLGATRASLVTYVIPVVAVAVGVIILDEPFEWSLLYGGALIIAGIALVHPPARLRRLPMQPVGPAIVLVLVALVVLPSLSCSSAGNAACGKAHTEPLNPNLGHVIASGAQPQYTTDPPTSGPHTPGALPGGVLTQPLTRPSQVGALEAGIVLVQYRDLSATPTSRRSRSSPAARWSWRPNPDLPDRVVATSWLNKQVCSAVDVPGTARIHQEPRGPRPWHRRVRATATNALGNRGRLPRHPWASGTRRRPRYGGSCGWRWADWATSRTRRRRAGRCGSCAKAPTRTSTVRPSSCWRTARASKAVDRLPPDLPLGYHDLLPDDGGADDAADRHAGSVPSR